MSKHPDPQPVNPAEMRRLLERYDVFRGPEDTGNSWIFREKVTGAWVRLYTVAVKLFRDGTKVWDLSAALPEYPFTELEAVLSKPVSKKSYFVLDPEPDLNGWYEAAKPDAPLQFICKAEDACRFSLAASMPASRRLAKNGSKGEPLGVVAVIEGHDSLYARDADGGMRDPLVKIPVGGTVDLELVVRVNDRTYIGANVIGLTLRRDAEGLRCEGYGDMSLPYLLISTSKYTTILRRPAD